MRSGPCVGTHVDPMVTRDPMTKFISLVADRASYYVSNITPPFESHAFKRSNGRLCSWSALKSKFSEVTNKKTKKIGKYYNIIMWMVKEFELKEWVI